MEHKCSSSSDADGGSRLDEPGLIGSECLNQHLSPRLQYPAMWYLQTLLLSYGVRRSASPCKKLQESPR